MQVEGSHRRGVNDGESNDRVVALAGVVHVLNDGCGRVDTELVGDGLFGARRSVVVCGDRQRVFPVRQVLICLGA